MPEIHNAIILITFTLVKRIGIAFFLRSYFFGFAQRFRIFGHAFVYNRWKVNVSKVFGFSVKIFDLLAVRAANAALPNIYTASLVQKFKIASLSWNLVLRLIQVCRIHWWCSIFLFESGNTLFGQIWSTKIKIVNLCWNLTPSLIRICRIQWWCSLLLFLTGNTLFGQIWCKNSKLSV